MSDQELGYHGLGGKINSHASTSTRRHTATTSVGRRCVCSAGVKVEHALDAVVSDAQASDVFWDYYSEDE